MIYNINNKFYIILIVLIVFSLFFGCDLSLKSNIGVPEPPLILAEDTTASSIILLYKKSENSKKLQINIRKITESNNSIFDAAKFKINGNGLDSGWERLELTGLDSNAVYKIFMTAKNSNNEESDNSNEIEFITKLKTPVISNIYSINPTQIYIEWSNVPGSNYYSVHCFLNESEPVKLIKWDITGTNCIIDVIEKNFFYCIQAHSDSNYSAYSSPKPVILKLNAPEIKNNGSGFLEDECVFETSVFLEWNSIENATAYEVLYYPANLEENPQYHLNKIITGTTNCLLDNLTHNTKYVFQVRAVNDVNNNDSIFSEKVFAITRIRKPAFFEAQTITAHSIDLHWELINDADASYYIESSTNADMAESFIIGPIINKNSFQLNNLMENVHCFLHLTAVGTSGIQSSPVLLDCYTLLTKPENFAVSEKTDNSVELKWSFKTGAAAYVIDVHDDASSLLFTTDIIKDTKFTVKNLSSNTTYKFIVRALNNPDKIYGEPTEGLQARTLLSSPSPIIKQYPNELFVSWNKIDYAEYYKIYCNTEGIMDSGEQLIATTSFISIGGLIPGTDYYIWVEAFNEDNFSLPSNMIKTDTITSAIGIVYLQAGNFHDPKLIGMPLKISRENRDSFQITALAEDIWDEKGFEFYLNGEKVWEGNSYILDWHLDIGPYVFTVIGTINGVPYGTSAYFSLI
ncbi:MAG: fibronectin type III domain-containing protein [Treponema sp.]|nr:fibronectin type III domain-containing protein [Treponema sp.]